MNNPDVRGTGYLKRGVDKSTKLFDSMNADHCICENSNRRRQRFDLARTIAHLEDFALAESGHGIIPVPSLLLSCSHTSSREY